MITDEQIDKKAKDYSLGAMTDDWMCDEHWSQGAQWAREQIIVEVSNILNDCFMLSHEYISEFGIRHTVIDIDRMLELFKRKGYEPINPF